MTVWSDGNVGLNIGYRIYWVSMVPVKMLLPD